MSKILKILISIVCGGGAASAVCGLTAGIVALVKHCGTDVIGWLALAIIFMVVTLVVWCSF